ncbi:MAG: hypothetical protein OXC72_10550 [Roseovarius sp.]|nr:hypothetical protein [Roseovarius sp.]
MTDFLAKRRFEMEPGQRAHADFAGFPVELTDEPGVWRKVWLFSLVPGNSWWLWGRFLPKPENCRGTRYHLMAFDACGGATSEVLHDRMKTAPFRGRMLRAR